MNEWLSMGTLHGSATSPCNQINEEIYFISCLNSSSLGGCSSQTQVFLLAPIVNLNALAVRGFAVSVGSNVAGLVGTLLLYSRKCHNKVAANGSMLKTSQVMSLTTAFTYTKARTYNVQETWAIHPF